MPRGRYNKVDEKNIKKDFVNYSNLKSKKIEVEGMEKMGKTLGIDIYTDTFITYFFFRCGCKKMEEVTENEYVTGLKYFGCNSLNDLKKQISSVREYLLKFESNEFKDFYKFLFVFNTMNTSKILSLEVVEVYFKNLFYNKFAISKDFINYLKAIKCNGLNKDQWECFLDFLLDQGTTFPKKYTCEAYYPIIIDKFYEWYCDLKKIPRKKKEYEDDE